MKKIKFFAVALSIICMCSMFTACNKNKKELTRLQQLEENVGDPSTPEEISAAIELYGERLDEIIAETQQTGVWYKLLGTRYLDNQQYGLALEAFQKAAEIYPANQNLYYYIGVCAGYLAKASLDYNISGDVTERDRYFALSESAYLRAIEIEPHFVRALYGISVLYVMYLNRPEEALPYLGTVLSVEPKHVEAMFVSARAQFLLGQFQKAADMYDKILATTADKTYKADAERNKKVALDALYQ